MSSLCRFFFQSDDTVITRFPFSIVFSNMLVEDVLEPIDSYLRVLNAFC